MSVREHLAWAVMGTEIPGHTADLQIPRSHCSDTDQPSSQWCPELYFLTVVALEGMITAGGARNPHETD